MADLKVRTTHKSKALRIFQFRVANSVQHKKHEGHNAFVFKAFVSFVSIAAATQW